VERRQGPRSWGENKERWVSSVQKIGLVSSTHGGSPKHPKSYVELTNTSDIFKVDGNGS
jgi:hypothetical protein